VLVHGNGSATVQKMPRSPHRVDSDVPSPPRRGKKKGKKEPAKRIPSPVAPLGLLVHFGDASTQWRTEKVGHGKRPCQSDNNVHP